MTFFDEIQYLIQEKKAFVLYRKPIEKKVFFVKENNVSQRFVFVSFDQKQLLIINYQEAIDITQEMKNSFDKVHLYSKSVTHKNITQEDYYTLIEKSLSLIKENTFSKVVLSRNITIDATINLLESYKKMLANYPNAYNYCWYHPESGIWIGATPETLANIEENQLQTVSLAGTKSLEEDWTEKEMIEQQVVTEYIVKQLATYSENIDCKPVETITAGKFQHLQTKITAKIKPNSIQSIVEKLHPTPAVCGIPTAITQSYIQENEGYGRKFYAGYLGEISENTASLYVNLRCAEVKDNQVIIYVGGGINHLSEPGKEWKETQMKAETIRSILVE